MGFWKKFWNIQEELLPLVKSIRNKDPQPILNATSMALGGYAGLAGAGAAGAAAGGSASGSTGIYSALLGGLGGILNSSGGTGKVFGIPTPNIGGVPMNNGVPQNGLQIGDQARAYYDAAFPGTTPWERLGSPNSAGGLAQQAMQAANAEKLQDKQIAMQEKQLDLQETQVMGNLQLEAQKNRITAMGYGSPYGVEAARSMLDLAEGRSGSSYQTPTSIQSSKLPYELESMMANTSLSSKQRDKLSEEILTEVEKRKNIPYERNRLREEANTEIQQQEKMKSDVQDAPYRRVGMVAGAAGAAIGGGLGAIFGVNRLSNLIRSSKTISPVQKSELLRNISQSGKYESMRKTARENINKAQGYDRELN